MIKLNNIKARLFLLKIAAFLVVASLLLFTVYKTFAHSRKECLSHEEAVRKMHAESEQFVIKVAREDTGLDVLRKSTANFQKDLSENGMVETLRDPDGAVFVWDDPNYGFTFRYAYGTRLRFEFENVAIINPAYESLAGKLMYVSFFPTPEWKSKDEILKDIDTFVKFFENHHWKRDKLFLESYHLKGKEMRGLPTSNASSEALMGWRANGYRIGLIATKRQNTLTKNQEKFRLSILIENMGG